MPNDHSRHNLRNIMIENQLSQVPGKTMSSSTANSKRTITDGSYTLSDLDMISPDTVVTSFLVYSLKPEHNPQLLIESFQHGVNEAAKQLPLLSAKIHFDSSNRPLRQMSQGSDRTLFHVRKFKPGEHQSYDQIAERSFLPEEFDRLRLLSQGAYDGIEEKPVCRIQLNFIMGGLILAFGFNHIATDGGGRNLATTLVCKCVKAYMESSTIPSFQFSYQRELFAACPELLSLPREQLAARVGDYQIIDTAPPINETQFQSPQQDSAKIANKGLIYRVNGEAAQRLKDSCRPLNGAKYLSTYDCIISMLWRSVMRIRTEMKPQLKTSESRFLHPIDLRRPGQGVPKNYFGNAVQVASAGPLQIADLLSHDGLSLAASSIRQSIESISLVTITTVTALNTMVSASERVVFKPSGGLLEENLMLTTWYFVNIADYDFGVGSPSTIRTWAAPIPGFALLFPNCGQKENSRVYDLYVTLSEVEHDMLKRDREFQSWFHVP